MVLGVADCLSVSGKDNMISQQAHSWEVKLCQTYACHCLVLVIE